MKGLMKATGNSAYKSLAAKDEFFTAPTEEEVAEITRILEAKNYFEVLEVSHEDDLDEKEHVLRKSYLAKCMLLNPLQVEHPKLDEASKKLFKAYDTLSDPQTRLEHRIEHFGAPEHPLSDIFAQLFGDIGMGDGGIPMIPSPGGGFTIILPPSGGNGMMPMMAAPRRQPAALPPVIPVTRRRPQPQAAAPGGLLASLFGPQPGTNRGAGADDSDDDDDDFLNAMFGPLMGQPTRQRNARQPAARVPVARRRNSNDSDESMNLLESFFRAPFGDLNQARAGAPAVSRTVTRAPMNVTRPAPSAAQMAARPVARQAAQMDPFEAMFRGLMNMGEEPRSERGRMAEQRVANARRLPQQQATRVQQAQRAPQAQGSGANVEDGMRRLREMGFNNNDLNRRALTMVDGDVQAAINLLLSHE